MPHATAARVLGPMPSSTFVSSDLRLPTPYALFSPAHTAARHDPQTCHAMRHARTHSRRVPSAHGRPGGELAAGAFDFVAEGGMRLRRRPSSRATGPKWPFGRSARSDLVVVSLRRVTAGGDGPAWDHPRDSVRLSLQHHHFPCQDEQARLHLRCHPGGIGHGHWAALSDWSCSQSGSPAAVAAAGEWVLGVEGVCSRMGRQEPLKGDRTGVDRFSR